MSLEGKIVIVTGAGRGLGKAYSEALAAKGANIVAADIRDTSSTVTNINDKGGKAIGLSLDVANMNSCQNMADKAISEFGNINVLINNAALYGDISGGRFDELSEEQWDNVMTVNIKGIWQCCKACVPSLREAGGGSIINISSLAAKYGMAYGVDYATSKAAVIGLTRSLARELGRDLIRVNAVAPSAVLTEGTDEFFSEKRDKALQMIAAGQSINRNLETDDLTGTIIYLASDSSKFVTGQTIMVDGGTVML